MKEDYRREKYKHENNHIICGVVEKESGELKHFVICDHNEELAVNRRFLTASEAIVYIQEELSTGLFDE